MKVWTHAAAYSTADSVKRWALATGPIPQGLELTSKTDYPRISPPGTPQGIAQADMGVGARGCTCTAVATEGAWSGPGDLSKAGLSSDCGLGGLISVIWMI